MSEQRKAILWFFLQFAAAAILMFLGVWMIRSSLAQESADDWWHLTVDLHAAMDKIHNEPDRKFIRQMINELSLSTETMPLPYQQRWLLSIKHELDKRRK